MVMLSERFADPISRSNVSASIPCYLTTSVDIHRSTMIRKRTLNWRRLCSAYKKRSERSIKRKMIRRLDGLLRLLGSYKIDSCFKNRCVLRSLPKLSLTLQVHIASHDISTARPRSPLRCLTCSFPDSRTKNERTIYDLRLV